MTKLSTRIKFGLLFLVPLLASFAVAGYFMMKCWMQLMHSSFIRILYIPLIMANVDNCLIFLLILIAMIGIFWPGRPKAELTFGMSFLIIFPAAFSAFAAVEVRLSSTRYKALVNNNELQISTPYERFITQNVLIGLDKHFQKEHKCCGILNDKYYCPSDDEIQVSPEDQHAKNMLKLEKVSRNKYLAGEYADKFPAEYKLPEETIPKSCCKCDKCEFKCDSTDHFIKKNNCETKGCSKALTDELDVCLKVMPLSYIFPWIAWIYTCVFAWINLRQEQGVSALMFGKVKAKKDGSDEKIDKTDDGTQLANKKSQASNKTKQDAKKPIDPKPNTPKPSAPKASATKQGIPKPGAPKPVAPKKPSATTKPGPPTQGTRKKSAPKKGPQK